MATSGSFNTSSFEGRYYKLSWTASQSVANNTSTISWQIEALGGDVGWYAERTLTAVINGVTVYSKSDRVERYVGVVASGTTSAIAHNGDGTKSISMSMQAAVYYSTVNCTGSSTVTLTTIPRASTITSASNITLGKSCSIKWTPLSTSFYYKLKFSLGSWSYTTGVIHPNQTSAYTYSAYEIPLTVANQLPSATSGAMTAYLYTYNSSSCSTQIGATSSKTFTVTVPSTIVPTVGTASITLDNSANSVVKGWGVYVVGYSKAKITATATKAYNSTISSFTISGGYSVTKSGALLSYTGSKFTSSGTKTFKVVAKDSRGRSSAAVTAKTSDGNTSITVYSYSIPTISSFKVSRSSKNAQQMVVTANWTYSSVNSKNSATATLYYKKSADTSWIKYSGSITKNASTTLTITFEETSSYDFNLIVTDQLSVSTDSSTYASKTASVSTIAVLMDFRAGGKGLGIGKIAESDAMEVAMKSNFYKHIYLANNIAIYGETVSGTPNEMISMSTNDNTIVGYGGYLNANGDTRIYGNDVILCSAAAGNNTYRPYHRAGDTIMNILYAAGYISSSGNNVHFTIPLYKAIIGSPTISLTSSPGFVIRQNNSYLYGSDGDTCVQPLSYSTTFTSYGIRVIATFSNSTNVINNSPCGIYWSGTIILS